MRSPGGPVLRQPKAQKLAPAALWRGGKRASSPNFPLSSDVSSSSGMSFQWGVGAGLPTLGSYRDAEPIEGVLLQRGRACEHRRPGAAADAHDVACERGEILQ